MAPFAQSRAPADIRTTGTPRYNKNSKQGAFLGTRQGAKPVVPTLGGAGVGAPIGIEP